MTPPPAPATESFGERVRRERRRRKMTQREAAAYFEIAQPSYHRWENGESLPGDELRPKVAGWLGLDLAELSQLMFGDDQRPTTHADVEEQLAALRRDYDDLVARVRALEDGKR